MNTQPATARPTSRAVRAWRSPIRKVALAALAVFFFALVGPAAAQDSGLALQLQRMRRDLSDLQAYVYSGKTPPPRAGSATGSSGADSGSMSRLQVQIQNLETQMRELTGRIEQVEFKITGVKTRLDKLIADVDLRLQALESGAAGAKPGAGTRSSTRPGGATFGGPAVGDKTIGSAGTAQASELTSDKHTLGILTGDGRAKLVKPPLASVPEGPGTAAGATSAKAGSKLAALSSATPKQQYDQAFDLLQRREYDDAATAFKVFVDGNADSPLASNALYWLGETHYFRKDYAEAARTFLDGFKRYPKGNKAPDSLLKLGKSLAALDEKKSACAAWKKLLKSFPKAGRRLRKQTNSEMSRTGCS